MQIYRSSSFYLYLALTLINLIFFRSITLFSIFTFFYLKYLYKKFKNRKRLSVLAAEFEQNLVYSPITGRIVFKSKSQHTHEIYIQHSFFESSDICLPITGEVRSVSSYHKVFGGVKKAKQGSFSYILELVSSDGTIVTMSMLNRTIIPNSISIIKEQDQGNIGAVFGQISWKGLIKINLPLNYIVNLKEGDKVVLGETPIATWS